MNVLTETAPSIFRPQLTEIANETGTDKGTVHKDGHAYTLVYEPLFEQLRDRPINLLEIGLSIGGPELGQPASRKVTDAPSIRMWHEYFPKARIFGIDISDLVPVLPSRLWRRAAARRVGSETERTTWRL